MYRAAVALASGDLDATIPHAQRALTLAPSDDPLARAAAGALAGLASWSTGDLSGAYAAYTESSGRPHQRRLPRRRARLHHHPRRHPAHPGPARGGAAHVSAGARPDRHSDGRRTVARNRRYAGRHRRRAARAQRPRRRAGTPGHQSAVSASTTACPRTPTAGESPWPGSGSPKAIWTSALALLDDADRVYVGDFSPNVAPVAATRARLWIRRGELTPANDWARQQQLSSDDDPSYLREYEHLTLARLLIAQRRTQPDAGDIDDALGLLARLLAAAEQGERGASVIEALILQAAAHDAAGDAAAALASLGRAVALAQPEGYVRLFIDEGPPMVTLLKTLRKQPAAPTYVNRLIASTTTIAIAAPVPQQLLEPLSQREIDVLRLLGGDLSGPDIARQLSVSLNTVRSHTKSIYAKLGTTSRRGAVQRARELRLIPGGDTRS